MRAGVGAFGDALEHGREVRVAPVRDPFGIERLRIQTAGEEVRADDQERIAQREFHVDERAGLIGVQRFDRGEMVIPRAQALARRPGLQPVDKGLRVVGKVVAGDPHRFVIARRVDAAQGLTREDVFVHDVEAVGIEAGLDAQAQTLRNVTIGASRRRGGADGHTQHQREQQRAGGCCRWDQNVSKPGTGRRVHPPEAERER